MHHQPRIIRPRSDVRSPILYWCDQTGFIQLNEKILLNGYIVATTRNLQIALRTPLIGDPDKVLWVNALCINQTDVVERNEQVSRMKFVYQRSQGVVLWLGDEYDN